MTVSDLAPAPSVFALRPGRGRVVLHATGFRHPRSDWLPGDHFTAYSDLTHLQLGRKVLRVGTRQGVFLIRRNRFAERDGPEHLVRALLERVVREPGGGALLARMAEVEETWRSPAPPRLTWLLVSVVLLVHAIRSGLGAERGPIVEYAGLFSTSLLETGELWRLVTPNLLHGGTVHLVANTLGLLVIGSLVERALGFTRTAFVSGLAAIGASLAALLAGYESMVGASGIVLGLAGAALWLELRLPERLPAAWRIPRRLFLAALAVDAVMPLFVPVIAGMAHVGGFLGGVAGAAVASGPGLRREPVRPALALATALFGAVTLLSVAGAGRLVVGADGAWQRHAERLLEMADPSPFLFNSAAWFIATAAEPSPAALESALQLAERAAGATGHRDPNILDTLAEAQARLAMPESALSTIDEAIALAPEEPYFREQRRRFTGDRDWDDRPPPPTTPLLPVPVPEPSLPAGPSWDTPGVPI